MKLALMGFAISYLFASCVPPNTPTAPPDASLPAGYRGTQAAGAPSLGGIPWQQFYKDPALDELIGKALTKNSNAQLAYISILAAGENLNITHANELPAVGATLSTPYQRAFGDKPGATPGQAFAPALSVDASYQIDLFGKLRSATAASRAQLLASEEARSTLLSSLVSQVATAYFQLRELDTTQIVTQKAAADRAASLHLVTLRVQYGQSSLQDQRQAEQSLYEVTSNLPVIAQNIAQTENALSVLCGEYPHAIVRGLPLSAQVDMPALPPTGIPSELLARRPDIRQADDNLVAADAQIDVARKLLLPSFSIGGSLGVQGQVSNGLFPGLPKAVDEQINGHFIGPTGLFALVPQLTQTIFSGGQLHARVQLAKDQQQQAVIAYLQTVQAAFQQVSNAMVAYVSQQAYREQEALYEAASIDSLRLANLRYDEGETSYLEVLNAETRAYQAAISTDQADLNERLALVQLYLALGGGLPDAR